jgi:TetR/AcrR family transcriptional regulator, transcriptional repressor for nem operon
MDERKPAGSGTATHILDVAERLVQTRGFNAFSYANVASEVKITKASMHYHFAGKAELGAALIDRYTVRFGQALAGLDEQLTDANAKLDAYADLYADVLKGQRMCLCGMLAAEYSTLPEAMQLAIVRFFDDNEAWLRRVLEQGRKDRSLRFTGSPTETARMIISGLEGAMLLARPYGDYDRFQSTARHLLASLTGPGPRPSTG